MKLYLFIMTYGKEPRDIRQHLYAIIVTTLYQKSHTQLIVREDCSRGVWLQF